MNDLKTKDELVYGYVPSIDRLRIILMFFMCINLLGFPTSIGGFVQTISGFAPLAFFVLSGYLVLWEREDREKRIVREIKRTAIVFAILTVVYFIINVLFYAQLGISVWSAFKSKRFWFNFLVMNVWQFDIGGAIWYVQALLYAYIIIYVLNKLKLLKLDWIIASLLIVLAVFTGELSGVFTWNIFGYTYLSANFFTRALPYVLLGGFIARKSDKIYRIPQTVYILGVPIGVALCYAELYVLSLYNVRGYSYSHLIGMGVIAVSLCMIAFTVEDHPGFEEFFNMSRFHINLIYYLCQPVSVLIALILTMISGDLFTKYVNYMGLFTFVLCFLIAWLVAFIWNRLFAREIKVCLKIAGIPIEIHTLFDSLRNFEPYITDEAPKFTVHMVKKDVDSEMERSMAECEYEGIAYQEYSAEELENTAVYRKIADKLPDFDAFVFHGSCVAVDGKAYLFTAKSGTGKTTHTNLWLKNIEGSYVINGDKPVLRIIDGVPYACGTPWMGKENYGTSEMLPLAGICLVNRGTENIIRRTDFKAVYPRLIGQTYRPENGALVSKTVKLLELVTENVPVYELYCNMDNEAALIAYDGMKNGVI